MRACAYIQRLVQQLAVGVMVCGAVPLTMFFSLATTNDGSLSPRQRLLAALKTWRGRILLGIDVCVSVLAAFGR
jgi:hypothetical protein